MVVKLANKVKIYIDPVMKLFGVILFLKIYVKWITRITIAPEYPRSIESFLIKVNTSDIMTDPSKLTWRRELRVHEYFMDSLPVRPCWRGYSCGGGPPRNFLRRQIRIVSRRIDRNLIHSIRSIHNLKRKKWYYSLDDFWECGNHIWSKLIKVGNTVW